MLSRNPYCAVPSAVENVGGGTGPDLSDQPDGTLEADPVEPQDRVRRTLG